MYFESGNTSLIANLIEYDLVLRTFSLSDIAFIKSVLDYEGISYYFFGEMLLVLNTVFEPASLVVKRDEVKKVLEILKSTNLAYISTL